MVNAYEKLGIPIDASEDIIKGAIAKCIGQNKIGLDEAEAYQKWLLNPAIRKQYNAKLFAEYPELIQQMVDDKVQKAKVQEEQPSQPMNIDKTKQNKGPSEQVNKGSTPDKKAINITIVVVIAIFLLSYFLANNDEDTKVAKAEKIAEKKAAEKETGMQTLARMGVKVVLKDPGSAQFRNQKGLCGEVNAKNSFGAYLGYTRFIAFGKDTAILDDGEIMEPIEFEKTWQIVCIDNKGYPPK